jgi:hypothetical protein
MGRSSLSTELATLERDHLQQLLDTLGRRGYRVVGPTVRDRAIVYDDLTSLADGRTSKTAAPTVSRDVTTRHSLATPLDPTPGRSSFTRRSRAYGKRSPEVTASR